MVGARVQLTVSGLQAIGDSLVDSVVSDNIPIFTEEEKFNEAVTSIVKRVEAKLTGATPSQSSAHLVILSGANTL